MVDPTTAASPLRGWSIARAWFGLSTLCAAVNFAALSLLVSIDLYTELQQPSGAQLVAQLGLRLWPSFTALVLPLSIWIALRIGAARASAKEKRIALALAISPALSALVSIGVTLWFFLR